MDKIKELEAQRYKISNSMNLEADRYKKLINDVETALLREKADGIFKNFYHQELYVKQLIEQEEIFDTYSLFNSRSSIYSDTVKLLFMSGGMFDKKVLAEIVSTQNSFPKILTKLQVKKYIKVVDGMVILDVKGFRVFKPSSKNIEKVNITDNKIARCEQYSRLIYHHLQQAKLRLIRTKLVGVDLNGIIQTMYREEAFKNASKFYKVIGFTDKDIAYFEKRTTNSRSKKKLFFDRFNENYDFQKSTSYEKYFNTIKASIESKDYSVFKDQLNITNTEAINELIDNSSLFIQYKLYDLYGLRRNQEVFDEKENKMRAKEVNTFLVNKEIEELTRKQRALGGIATKARQGASDVGLLPSELKVIRKNILIEKKKLEDLISFTVKDKRKDTTLMNLNGQGYFLERYAYSEKKKKYLVRIGILTYQSSSDKEFLYRKLKLLINFFKEIFGDGLIELHFTIYVLFNNVEYIKSELDSLIGGRVNQGHNPYAGDLQNIRYVNLSKIID